jgi:hypothetical protein
MIECAHEAAVLEAIVFDRIASVRDHLATCASCAELAGVAAALHEDHRAACREARPPSAGAVWWRATIRARAEATRTVSKPITVAQSVAGACAVGLAVALLGVVWRAISWGGLSDLLERFSERRADIEPMVSIVLHHALPLTLALAACLIFAPLALYLALSDD